MVRLHVLTAFDRPMLWIWRDRTRRDPSELAYDATYVGLDADGLHQLEAPLDHQIHEHVHALLHTEGWAEKERDEHAKRLPRAAEYRFVADLWVAEGATRVVTESPFAAAFPRVRVHLITARKYRGGKLYVWTPGGPSRRVDAASDDDPGPVFDVALEGRQQHLFLFKFVDADGRFEPEYANRLWTSADGDEIWVHSQSSCISKRRPELKPLVVHVLEPAGSGSAQLHLWQEDSDFVKDVPATPEGDGWIRFEHPVYTHREYRFKVFDPGMTPPWEHDEAVRNVVLDDRGVAHTISGTDRLRPVGDSGVWTIEGDRQLFGSRPAMDQRVVLEVADRDPACGIDAPTTLEVWVNRSRTRLHVDLRPGADGRWSFATYPDVVTSFRFGDGTRVERLGRHYLKVAAGEQETRRFVVLGRADPLASRPPPDLFADPLFPIERPGPWVADGEVRFALHCPTAALAEVVGEWTDWQQSPVPMRSTRDGAYWWARVPVSDITGRLGRGIDGVLYKFRLDEVRLVQDPAADWVESSEPEKASRLVDHGAYAWRSTGWQRPGWEYLTIYQLHPTRFSQRNGARGFDAVTRELTSSEGYLRKVKATAILLMPTCEFHLDCGWGYNPSFFYSVESAYGGPDRLKGLVDACHEQGLAVLLDVVFNHAGTDDNVLWSVARESFFDGDTEWGAMINFDHPQVIHFFERNLTHFMDHYRIDGFRFDFTRVIRFGGEWSAHVRAPGSGGGWEFMQKLRAAVHERDGRCILMAENLPNDWDLTDPGGPMDTQWCDDFHDILLEASQGHDVMGRLADAMKLTHTSCREWYETTNYPESHDEVGNEPHRISSVAYPQGLRRNKIAAAATLLSRGIPLWFMGAESGEWRQFSKDGDAPLDLDAYEDDEAAKHLRAWWNSLSQLRRGNPRLQGPAPLRVHFAEQRMLAFSRGDAADLFVLLNFGDWSGRRSLAELNLPDGEYKELLNSTWGDYRVAAESEDEHSNGGWDARLGRQQSLNVPEYGVVVLERR